MNDANQPKENGTGFSRIIKATHCSLKGLRFAWTHESAFRQEAMLALIMGPIAFIVAQTTIELILLIMTLFIVLIVEVINSAVEAAIDRIGSERHALSGAAKDLGSFAVMLALFVCGGTWIAIIWENFIK